MSERQRKFYLESGREVDCLFHEGDDRDLVIIFRNTEVRDRFMDKMEGRDYGEGDVPGQFVWGGFEFSTFCETLTGWKIDD